jgi:hypothetical protein
MKLPHVDDAQRMAGLFVFTHGEWTGVGYTAGEVAMLFESEQYRDGRAYRICRVTPDGRMELRGVDNTRFELENAMLFYRGTLADARSDFDALRGQGQRDTMPCRAFAHLADRGPDAAPHRYVTALIYPAEYDNDVASWLLRCGFEGGDVVEGGVSHVSNYYAEQNTVLAREQFWNTREIPSRSREEVLRSVGRAVQR